MSSVTPNLNLTLPVGEENVSRQIINENMQKIDTAYGNLQGGVMRKVPFSVTVGDWTLDDGVYVAEFATAYVTASSSEFAFYTASYSQYAVSDIIMDKKPGGGALVFTTADIPTGTIAGTLYVFDNNDGKIPVIMEDTVLPIANGGTGENTLAGAKNALGVEQLESDVADINAHLGNIPVIKTDSFTGTTSASGNVSKAHASRVIILSAWTDGSDRIVTPFPGSGAGATGQYTWWFQVFSDNSSHSVIANTSVTIYYAYIQID